MTEMTVCARTEPLQPLTASLLDGCSGVVHGFFTRAGGVSAAGTPYAGLNCGPGSNDDPQAVAANRARVAAVLGVPSTRLVSLHQAHTPRAVVVDDPWAVEDRPVADGMVTTRPDIALGILTADCGPVLLADCAAGVIGACHAGWKGAVEGVVEATVAAMVECGARRVDITAALGPTIGPKSYEVGPEFRDRFHAQDPAFDRFFRPGEGDRLLFDLPAFILSRLSVAGVPRAMWIGEDTLPNPARYFSYRYNTQRGGTDYGRLISAIRLTG